MWPIDFLCLKAQSVKEYFTAIHFFEDKQYDTIPVNMSNMCMNTNQIQ